MMKNLSFTQNELKEIAIRYPTPAGEGISANIVEKMEIIEKDSKSDLYNVNIS